MITITGQKETRSEFEGAVSAEEHNILRVPGNSIAQSASKTSPVPIEYEGTYDTFGESGTPSQLLEKYGLDSARIISAAEKVIERKNK